MKLTTVEGFWNFGCMFGYKLVIGLEIKLIFYVHVS